MTTNNDINFLNMSSTGSGKIVLQNSPVLTLPLISGITNASTAATGSVGEIISVIIPKASSISFTNNTDTQAMSLALTAGDWDVWGNASIHTSLGYSISSSAWLSTGTSFSDLSIVSSYIQNTQLLLNLVLNIPVTPVNISSPTTYYLVINSTVDSGSFGVVCGEFYARRAR